MTFGRRLQEAVFEPGVVHLKDVNCNVTTPAGMMKISENVSSAFCDNSSRDDEDIRERKLGVYVLLMSVTIC